MRWIDCLGFCASTSVLASFCMTTMIPLRSFAVLSNILFILYGLLGHIYPVFFLHVVLLPVNLVKLGRTGAQPADIITSIRQQVLGYIVPRGGLTPRHPGDIETSQ